MGNGISEERRKQETALVNEKAKEICKILQIDSHGIRYTSNTNFNDYTAEVVIDISQVEVSIKLVDHHVDSLSFILTNDQTEALGRKIVLLWPHLTEVSKYKWGSDSQRITISFEPKQFEELITGLKNILSE